MKFFKTLAVSALLAALVAGASGASAQDGRSVKGGGGDIIIFDIVDSVQRASRPAGGGGVGGDIIVFDIVDSVQPLVPGSTGVDILIAETTER
ncbi:MAG: hypothetical protein KME04_07165 [Pleurocapsa minor GSE-CHR-MK-17-07R]|nr:hypothetical protein [Pleurocapsa minor GSE-CHR-MK 17-07R]